MATKKRGDGLGRGSRGATEKRAAARALNQAYTRHVGTRLLLDGRNERRRRRLLAELKTGRGGKALSPIDVLTHAAELLTLGETMASIKRAGVKPLPRIREPEVLLAARRVWLAYDLPPEVFELLGVELGK